MIESSLDKVMRALKRKTAISFLSPRMGALVRRRLMPGVIQDVSSFPLDQLVLDRIPPSLRGQTAVTGFDYGRRENRTYFVEFMTDIRFLPPPKFAGEPHPVPLFAVVEPGKSRVLARGLSRAAAEGFSRRWTTNYGEAVVEQEPIDWPTDDQVIERLKLAR